MRWRRATAPTATPQQKIKEQADLIQLLETADARPSRCANEMQLEQLNAQLQREQLERTMAEGALESGRKDIARLLARDRRAAAPAGPGWRDRAAGRSKRAA